jgi:peptidoglycan/LPS O-acetylase OafA/YrhL
VIDVTTLVAFSSALLFSPSDLLPILLCPALVLSLAFGRGPISRLLQLGPPHSLGQISYSVYLVHYCVLGGLNLLPIASSPLYAASAVALTLAISTATYHGIERPARRGIAQLTLHRQPATQEVGPPS